MKHKTIFKAAVTAAAVTAAILCLCLTACAAAYELNVSSVKLIIGESTLLIMKDAGSTVTWTSSDSSVASVSSGVVVGVGKGKAQITAKFGSVSRKCAVTVGEYRIASKSNKLTVGGRQRLELLGWQGERKWSSADSTVVTVGADGVLRGVREGKTKILCSFGENTLKLTVTVTPYSMPLTAAKTAYIKFTPRAADLEDFRGTKPLYITDKEKIKSLISYIKTLDFSFVEPEDYSSRRAEGFGEDRDFCPETLVFYDAAGEELARFESPADSSEAQSCLGTFFYLVKSYNVNGRNDIINKLYGWRSSEQLCEDALAAAKENTPKSTGLVLSLSYIRACELSGAPVNAKSGGYAVKARCRCSDGTVLTVCLDPLTGKTISAKEEKDA